MNTSSWFSEKLTLTCQLDLSRGWSGVPATHVKALKIRGSKIVGYSGRNRVFLGGLGWPTGNGIKDMGALTLEVTERLVSGNPGQPHKALSHGVLSKSLSLQKGFGVCCVLCHNAEGSGCQRTC